MAPSGTAARPGDARPPRPAHAGRRVRSHGYGIASVVHDLTAGDLAIEDAALYQALHRLDGQGLVEAEWRPSENNRRARYYTLTAAGRRRLKEETAAWRRYSRAVEAVLEGR